MYLYEYLGTGYIILYLIKHHKVKQKWNITKNVKPYT